MEKTTSLFDCIQKITTHNSANTLNYSTANDGGFRENLIIWAGDKGENGE